MKRAAPALILLAACNFSRGDDPNGPGPDVDAPPPVDAPPVIDAAIDAPPDAPPVACPTDYEAVTGAPSRYKRIGPGIFEASHNACKGDLSGHTHLVVLDSVAESNALRMRFQEDWWVGAVQRPDQQQPGSGWRNITGGDLTANLWASGQPNDQNDNENNAENVAVRRGGGLEDVAETDSHPALCECDHKAVDPDVADDIPD